LIGDFNHDGIVDNGDYIVWRKAAGTLVKPFAGADGDGNGVVNQDDYRVLRAHFGESLPGLGHSETAAIASVPRSESVVDASLKPESATGDSAPAGNLDAAKVSNAGEGASTDEQSGATLDHAANAGIAEVAAHNLDSTSFLQLGVDPIDIVVFNAVNSSASSSALPARPGNTAPSAPSIAAPAVARNRTLNVSFEEAAKALCAAIATDQGSSFAAEVVNESVTPRATTGDYGLNDTTIDIVMTTFGESTHSGGLLKRSPRMRSGANR
jgi:hypothetical protein